MTVDEALSIVDETTGVCCYMDRVTPRLRQALDTLYAAGAHPVTCDEIWRVSRWTQGLNPQRTLSFHREKLREQLGR